MNDILSFLQTLTRPKLLIEAARLGVPEYRRKVHLRRILGRDTLPNTGAAIMKLVSIEAEIDDLRRKGDANYNVVRHVEILIAMIGEARAMGSA